MNFVIIVIATSQPPNSLQIKIEAQHYMGCYCGSMRSVGSWIAGWQYWLRRVGLCSTKLHKKQTFQFERCSGSVFADCMWENETMQRSSRYSYHQIWLVRAFVSLRTRVKFTKIYIYIQCIFPRSKTSSKFSKSTIKLYYTHSYLDETRGGDRKTKQAFDWLVFSFLNQYMEWVSWATKFDRSVFYACSPVEQKTKWLGSFHFWCLWPLLMLSLLLWSCSHY